MRNLFFAIWDSYERRRYKPDEYLLRVKSACTRFIGVGWSGEKILRIINDGFTPHDVTQEVIILKEFAEISMELWKAVCASNLQKVMADYSKELQRLEQKYQKCERDAG